MMLKISLIIAGISLLSSFIMIMINLIKRNKMIKEHNKNINEKYEYREKLKKKGEKYEKDIENSNDVKSVFSVTNDILQNNDN